MANSQRTVMRRPPRGTSYSTGPYCCCWATSRTAPKVPAFVYVCETVAGGRPEPDCRPPSPKTSVQETNWPGMLVPNEKVTCSGWLPDTGSAARLNVAGVPLPTVMAARLETTAQRPGLTLKTAV